MFDFIKKIFKIKNNNNNNNNNNNSNNDKVIVDDFIDVDDNVDIDDEDNIREMKVCCVNKNIKKSVKNFEGKEIKRMLIVDDVELISNTMKEYILLSGYDIDIMCANSGKECLKILEDDNNFDVVFMDLIMYPIDGYETSKEIIKKYDNINVFALTGMVDSESIEKCKDIGITSVFQKPVNYEYLIENIKDHGLYFKKK